MGTKRGGHALDATDLPAPLQPQAEKPRRRAPGRPKQHAQMPPESEPEARGEYIVKAFRAEAEKAAAASKRRAAGDAHVTKPEMEERRERTLYSHSQLTADQVAAIEVDYRAGIKPVKAICTENRIHLSTLYKLAEQRSWPLRSTIQMQMADAVSDALVNLTTSELRRQQHGPSGEDRPVDPLAALADDAVGNFEAGTGQKLLPAAAGESIDDIYRPEDLAHRSIEDIAATDLVIERYAIATAMVLKQHRTMAQAAVQACSDLTGMVQTALNATKERVTGLQHDPAALTKQLDPLAKVLASAVATMQKAIDMQRQAFALDESAGKGLALGDLARRRAVAAGLARPDEAAGAEQGLPAPGNDAGAGEAMPLPSELGGYDAIVRAAEARGLVLA